MTIRPLERTDSGGRWVFSSVRCGDAEHRNADNAETDARALEERDVLLRDFTREAVTRFKYVYDFGDNWIHSVCLEKHVALDPQPRVAACVDGARARPPEDVGGSDGYRRFLEVLAEDRHEEHAQMKRWCGGHFNPEWFDLVVVNKDLGQALKANVKRRPRQPRSARKSEPGTLH